MERHARARGLEVREQRPQQRTERAGASEPAGERALIPYASHQVTAADETEVLNVLRSDRLTQGPTVEVFEAALANKCGARYAVACNSGTAALWLAYSVLGPDGSPVYMPAISFIATANTAVLSGHRPIFQDVDPDTGLVTKPSVIGVTLGGQPTGYTHLVLDACHGPLHLPLGTDLLCLSFHPAKHVACGEGGAVVTNKDVLAQAMRSLRDHGRIDGYCIRPSFNFRLDEMSAALGLSQLARYQENVTARRAIAARYDAAFSGKVQAVQHSPDSARHLYSLLVDNRDDMKELLRRKGIGTAVHFRAMHLEPFYVERMGYRRGELPGAEKFAARTLSIPLYPTLTEDEQEQVIAAVLEVT